MKTFTLLACFLGATADLGINRNDLDALKGQALTVKFFLQEKPVRDHAIERIKTMVGNRLRTSSARSVNGNTTLEVSPVDDPKAFVEKLKELGKVGTIEGAVVHLQIDPAKVRPPQSDVGKDGGKPIDVKNQKGYGEVTGNIAASDPAYKSRRHKLLLFDMEAGKTYQVEMASTAFPCCLFVEDPQGNLLAKNGPNGADYSARVSITATVTGKHRIMAGAFGSRTGQFTLAIRQLEKR